MDPIKSIFSGNEEYSINTLTHLIENSTNNKLRKTWEALQKTSDFIIKTPKVVWGKTRKNKCPPKLVFWSILSHFFF